MVYEKHADKIKYQNEKNFKKLIERVPKQISSSELKTRELS